jgi:hypothetical protein
MTTELPTFTPEEVAVHRATWTGALRSGGYAQARQYLRRLLAPATATEPERVGYCCLGVAEQLRGCRWIRRHASGGTIWSAASPDDGETRGAVGTLTVAGRRWLGVAADDPVVPFVGADGRWKYQYLTVLNDDSEFDRSELDEDELSSPWSFARIADAVAALPVDWDGTTEYARDYAARRNEELDRERD